MLQLMQQRMQQQGIRRLLVISGDPQWCREQAQHLAAQLPGDWLWVSDHAPPGAAALTATAAKTVLGQERLHAVFDAAIGLNVEALAQLSGTLRAGSWLLLLVPPWHTWAQQQDSDSLRWSDCSQAIATPNFIHHLQQQLLVDSEVSLWRQPEPLRLAALPVRPDWQVPQGSPSPEQQTILSQLLAAGSGIWVLTGARGRGKSTLAGMLIAQTPLTCFITGPSRAAIDIAHRWAGGKAQFWAIDALLQHCREHSGTDIGWLLVDEAAAIPTPLLQQLIRYFPRVLLTTTVQGYEGTGRGFLLKFCAGLANCQRLNLQQPVRWAQSDPLERIIDHALLLTEEPVWPVAAQPLVLKTIEQAQLCADPHQLRRFYSLLCSAHYRTSPLDLRRLMDAPGMHFSAACLADDVIGALWLVDEGGLSTELAHEVWAGRRRGRGNLVAQSLAAHSGQWWAPTLYSRRITRIAVLPPWRQQNIATRLIEQQKHDSATLDFLSVSFGYTEPLWRFWQRCGFTLVRIGNKPEASSGCYTAMALLPISEQGKALCHAAHQQLIRNWHWLKSDDDLPLPFTEGKRDERLNEDDWRELAGFAFAHRPLEASLAALQRLLLLSPASCVALRGYLQQQQTVAQCAAIHRLPGRKALLHHWRQEVAQALQQRDEPLCSHWQRWSQPLK